MLEIIIIMPVGDGKSPGTKRNTDMHRGTIVYLLSKKRIRNLCQERSTIAL